MIMFALFAAMVPVASVSAAPPRLVAVIVIDQMRADYLQRFASEFTGGFARLQKEGAVFTKARQGYVPTETAPGHAALLTGCFPSQHGIIGNEWWDREHGESLYSVADPEYGMSPAHLQCPTVGDILKAADPSAVVVSIAGKDRPAIIMGGQHPDLALWYDRSAGQFVSSGYYGRMPDWVWNWDADLRIPVVERDTITRTTRFDPLAIALAEKAIENEKMGMSTSAVPSLLLLSLSGTDLIGHWKGPDSPEVRDQLEMLDRELGRFFDFLDQRVGKARYTVALSADHGVASMPESVSGRKRGYRRIMFNDFAAQIEKGLIARFGPPPAGEKWLLMVRPPHVYLNVALAKAQGIAADHFLIETSRLLAAHWAVAHVFDPEVLRRGGDHSRYWEEFQRSVHSRGGDLMILVKEGVLLTGSVTDAGHNLPYDDDASIPLILMGAGIRRGVYSREALGDDLAPTLGRLLGVEFPQLPGTRVLSEALSEKFKERPR